MGREHTSNNDPSKRHCRDNHDKQADGVICQVGIWEVYANGEEPDSEGDAHDLQCYGVDVATPSTRIEDIGAIRATYHAKGCAE